jgi:hypothetical protein
MRRRRLGARVRVGSAVRAAYVATLAWPWRWLGTFACLACLAWVAAGCGASAYAKAPEAATVGATGGAPPAPESAPEGYPAEVSAAPSPPPPPAAPGAIQGAPFVTSQAGVRGPSSAGGQLLASNDVAKDVAAAKAVPDSPHSAAMLVYTANLGMAVYQVAPGLDGVERVAREVGGYLSSRQDTSVTVRVPRDRFDEAVGRIEKLGDVTHRDIKAQDVTDEFVDVQARLKNAYAMRDRLTDLLARAASKDALDIEKELGRVTEEIERMEGRLKLLRDQIAFSTITVTFTPLAPQTVRDSSLLAPFPWLQDLGLGALLDVH